MYEYNTYIIPVIYQLPVDQCKAQLITYFFGAVKLKIIDHCMSTTIQQPPPVEITGLRRSSIINIILSCDR